MSDEIVIEFTARLPIRNETILEMLRKSPDPSGYLRGLFSRHGLFDCMEGVEIISADVKDPSHSTAKPSDGEK